MQFSKSVMSNDYFIPFLNPCVKTLNNTHCKTEGVFPYLFIYFERFLIYLFMYSLILFLCHFDILVCNDHLFGEVFFFKKLFGEIWLDA